jgi:hypothetical protein
VGGETEKTMENMYGNVHGTIFKILSSYMTGVTQKTMENM